MGREGNVSFFTFGVFVVSNLNYLLIDIQVYPFKLNVENIVSLCEAFDLLHIT